MPDLLRELITRGPTLAVLTGKGRPRTVQLLVELGLIAYFDAVPTPDDPPAAKPAPDSVLWSAARADVDVRDVVVIGDAPGDITAESTAGAIPIGYACGLGTARGRYAVGADQVIRSVAQLAAALHGHLHGINLAREIETPT